MQDKLLKLLRKNARLSNEELATMLGVSTKEIANEIDNLEKNGTIRKYTTIVDEDKLGKNVVTARIEVKATPEAKHGYKNIAKSIAKFPEVETVYLMSGDHDLGVTVKCSDIKEIGQFVAEQLSAIDGVLSISTHFVIGRYKELGEEIDVDDEDEREWVSP